jgi:hypothetical protein
VDFADAARASPMKEALAAEIHRKPTRARVTRSASATTFTRWLRPNKAFAHFRW